MLPSLTKRNGIVADPPLLQRLSLTPFSVKPATVCCRRFWPCKRRKRCLFFVRFVKLVIPECTVELYQLPCKTQHHDCLLYSDPLFLQPLLVSKISVFISVLYTYFFYTFIISTFIKATEQMYFIYSYILFCFFINLRVS